MKTKVIVRTGGFKIMTNPDDYATIQRFLERMHQQEFVKSPVKQGGSVKWVNQKKLKAVWYTKRSLRDIVVHHSYLDEFRRYCKHLDISYVNEAPIAGDKTFLTMLPSYTPKPAQVPYVSFLSSPEHGRYRTLGASTGAGKTASHLAAIVRMGLRSITYIPANLRDNWLGAIDKFVNAEPDDVLYIAGKDALIEYQNKILAGDNKPAIVLMSIPTMRSYLATYDGGTFPMSPMEFLDKGGFGISGVDEAHKDAHYHMISSSVANCANHLYLSATIISDDEYLSDIQNRTMPVSGRCPVPPPSDHIEYKAYRYGYTQFIPKFKGMMGYSHAMLEGELAILPTLRDAYYLMLAKIIWAEYMVHRIAGEKALVYFSSTRMVHEFAEFLKTARVLKEAFSEMNVVEYKAGQAETVIEFADIIVTTVKKAGTGVDIANLTTVVQTISISSTAEVKQNIGRLRDLQDIPTRFIAVYSTDIDSQIKYQNKRLESIKDQVFKRSVVTLPIRLPYPTAEDFKFSKDAKTSARLEKLAESRRKAKKRGMKKNKTKPKRFNWGTV